MKAEDLHFGVDFTDDRPPRLYKKLRDNREVDLPWKNGSESRTLDILKLAKRIKVSLTSAEFALEMIEGVDMVEFKELA